MSFGFLPNQISVLGFGLSLGQDKTGVAKAPQAFVEYGLLEKLQKECSKKVVFENLNFKHTQKSLKSAAMRNQDIGTHLQQIFLKTKTELEKKHFTFSLGGDHAIAFATISAAASQFKNLKVVWIDAHGDANTMETSPTQNMHGMPVAGILGFIRNQPHFEWLTHFVDPKNIAILGIRSLDEGEKQFLEKHGICYFTTDKIRNTGVDAVLNEVSTRLRLEDEAAHYLSFDVDAVDPRFAPSTGTPEEKGLLPEEVVKITRWLSKQGKLVGMDCVEVNPEISSYGLAPTLQVCMDMMSEITKQF